jgi:hypothetical protein
MDTDNLIPIARMDREPGNGTRPCERDSNAQLIALAPQLYGIVRAALMAGYLNPELAALARPLVETVEAREERHTPGPWVCVSGMVYAAG